MLEEGGSVPAFERLLPPGTVRLEGAAPQQLTHTVTDVLTADCSTGLAGGAGLWLSADLHDLSLGCKPSPRGCDPTASQWVCPCGT